MTEINPHRLYNVGETARLLSVKQATVYGIPSRYLPREKVRGERRVVNRYRGSHILDYLKRRAQAPALVDPAKPDLSFLSEPAEVAPGLIELPVAWKPGVYFLARAGEIIYIGQSRGPFSRIVQHAADKEFDRAFLLTVPAVDLDAVEGALIRLFRPQHNTQKWAPGDPLLDKDILDRYCPWVFG